MTRFSRTAWLRIGLLAILPALMIAQWQYAHDTDSRIRLHFLSDDGQQVIYANSRHDWLRHHEYRDVNMKELTLVHKSASAEQRHVLPFHDYFDISISPDGSRVAAVTHAGLVAICDVPTGRLIQTRQLPISRAESLELHFSRDGRYLAAQTFLSTQWLLQIMEASTLRVTQDVGTGWTIAWMTHEHLLVGGNMDASGSSPKLINHRFASIEQGQLSISNESVPDGLVDISSSGRFELLLKQDPENGYEIIDRESKTSRFVPTDATVWTTITPAEDALLILTEDQVLRIDLVTGKRLSAESLDTQRANGMTLSANGRFMAVYTRADAIEIWNVTTGKRIETLPCAAPHWRLWTTGVVGTMAWCGAWLSSGWRQRSTFGVCADILLASVVGGIGLYLRRLFAGDPDAYDRLSVIGTFAMMYGMSALCAFWLVHGTGRWSWRLPAFLAGFALLWSAPVWIWYRFKLPSEHVPIIALGISAFLILVMTVPRRSFKLQSATAGWQLPAGGRVHQVPLRDLLLIPGAIGLFIAVAKLVERPTNLIPWLVGFGVSRCLCQALICTVAVHIALSTARPAWRFSTGLVAIAILSVAAPLTFHRFGLQPWWCFAATDCATGLYVLLALLLVRRHDWRLTNRREPTQVSVAAR